MDGLYDTDFYAWTQEQGRRLRTMAASRVNESLDWEHIAEEIESTGRSDHDQMDSRLATILEHMLKLAFSTLPEPQRQWANTVRTQRTSLLRLLRKSPSLRRHLPDDLAECYADALKRLQPNLIELSMDPLPEDCPFDLDEQILNEDWLPEPPYR